MKKYESVFKESSYDSEFKLLFKKIILSNEEPENLVRQLVKGLDDAIIDLKNKGEMSDEDFFRNQIKKNLLMKLKNW